MLEAPFHVIKRPQDLKIEIFIYLGFSVLLEVVLSLENITLNANLNFKMIYCKRPQSKDTRGTDTSEVLESSRQRLRAASLSSQLVQILSRGCTGSI